jgi:hypothetical protein
VGVERLAPLGTRQPEGGRFRLALRQQHEAEVEHQVAARWLGLDRAL